MAASRALELKILANIDSLNQNLKRAQDQVNGAGMSMERSFDQVKRAVTVASVAVVGFAAAYGKTAVEAASNLAETVAKTQVIFGNSATAIETWSKTSATAFGQSQRQALDAASTFAVFGKSAGLAGDDLVGFSTDFTVLASDLASFNNTSPEQAITAIGAALRGESEPIRQYGVLINEAALRQAALELGIVKTTKEALTPQQRVLAAQKLIFDQTSDAQGDYARTSEGLANQQRSLRAQLENVNAEIGTKLLPYIIELTKFINEKAIPFVTKYKDEIQIAAVAVVALSVAVLAVNAGLKLYNAAIVIATVASAAFNAIMLATPVGWVVAGIAAVVAGMIILESRTGMLRKIWEMLTNALKDALDWFKRVANFFGAEFETAAMKQEATLKRNVEVWDESRRAANQVQDGLRQGVIPQLKATGAELDKSSNSADKLAGKMDKLTAASDRTTNSLKEQFTALEALDLIRAGFGSVVGATSPGQLPGGESFRSAAELVGQFGGFIPGFNQLPTDPFYGFGKGSDIRNFTPGSVGQTNNTININVNGTVVDPEGTARAVQRVIQDSAGRAGNLQLGALLGVE